MTGNAGQELPIRGKDTTGAVGNGLALDAKDEKTSGYRQPSKNCIARLPAELIQLIGSHLGKSSPSDLCHFAASTPHTWALLKDECHKKAIEIAEPTPEEFKKWLTETNGRSRFDIWAEVIDSNMENERSKFVDAVRAGRFDVVESFLAHGIDPNTHNIFGNRALNIAANGHRPLEMCKLLLKHGANPNLSDFLNSKYNGLYSAAIFAGDDVVQLLMENGADVKVKGLIHTFFQYCNADTIRRAFELGADIHEVDKRGNNVLHFAARNKKAEKAEVLRLAFDLGFPSANINDRNLGGKTPLLKAVKIGHQENVALLLEYGALPDISVKGMTALQMAFNKDDIAIVSLLAKAGADLEVVDEDGWRPLQIAAWQASEEMIQVLVENGADTSATTADQDSVLHLLLDGLDEDDNQPYIDSILRCVKLLVAAKADPRAQNVSGETPLDMVPEVGFHEIT